MGLCARHPHHLRGPECAPGGPRALAGPQSRTRRMAPPSPRRTETQPSENHHRRHRRPSSHGRANMRALSDATSTQRRWSRSKFGSVVAPIEPVRRCCVGGPFGFGGCPGAGACGALGLPGHDAADREFATGAAGAAGAPARQLDQRGPHHPPNLDPHTCAALACAASSCWYVFCRACAHALLTLVGRSAMRGAAGPAAGDSSGLVRCRWWRSGLIVLFGWRATASDSGSGACAAVRDARASCAAMHGARGGAGGPGGGLRGRPPPQRLPLHVPLLCGVRIGIRRRI